MEFKKPKSIYLVFLLVLCLVVMEEASAKAVSQMVQNRKMLVALEKEIMHATGLHGSSSSAGSDGNLVGWGLRTVPSGPDPLHHNIGSPKKPRTP